MSQTIENKALTRQDVVDAYKALLGRHPENEAVVSSILKAVPGPFELALAIVRSSEFQLGSRRFEKNLVIPEKLILVGTHHKSGTVWLGDVFVAIARGMGMRFLNAKAGHSGKDIDILFQVDSAFNLRILQDYRGIHIIRDPRDIIISGAFYHGSTKSESWLLEKDEKFRNLSYQEKIKSIQNLEYQFIFEMENRGGRTIREMASWNYQNKNIKELRYELLIRDKSLKCFTEIFQFLGFEGLSLAFCLECAWYKSIFSGHVDKNNTHVRSGQPRQWEKYFSKDLANEFLRQFGDVLIKLGYEKDDEWARKL